MQYQHLLKPMVLSVMMINAVLTLTACGGSGGNDSVKDKPKDTPKDTPKIITLNSLVKAGSSENFAKYYLDASNGKFDLRTVLDGSFDKKAPVNSKMSSTNLIEEGVDELDYVKQNAENIFVTKTSADGSSSLNVFAKPSVTPIANLPLDAQSFKGLYLTSDNLHSLKQASYGGFHDKNSKELYQNGTIKLDTISVTNPSAPSISKTFKWEGHVEDSRRIGDSVYVVSSSRLNNTESCPIYVTYNDSSASTSKTHPCDKPNTLTPEQIAEQMPIDINGNKVNTSQCYIPSKYNTKSNNLSNNITLITKVDISGNDNHKTTCIAASSDKFYMSMDALYLSSSGYNYSNDGAMHKRSIISKFNLGHVVDYSATDSDVNSEAVIYTGTGIVEGTIDRDASSFAMNEHNGFLRVVTSKPGPEGVVNMLHILQESDKHLELENIASLPNANRTKPLGKPNERIKGIRFMGDEAYIVTFKRTDPLYKIDLSNPNDPKIMGDLEMPGYSAYLHRINDKFLLGVGYEMAENKWGRMTPSDIQVTVFDTSKDTPVIVDQDTISMNTKNNGWFTLPVDNDSRAITTLLDANRMRVSIPYKIESYKSKEDVKLKGEALEYSIDFTTGMLNNKIKRDTFSTTNQYSPDMSRSLIDNDDVYYSNANGSLIKYIWNVK